MPLTAVGKIFKPALRHDAIRRVADALLRDLPGAGERCDVSVVADPTHGQLIRVSLAGPGAFDRLQQAVHDRLGPLSTRHTVVAGA